MDPLDTRLSQALMALRTLETAVHDRGPWTLLWRGVHHPAQRSIDSGSVTFSAFLGPSGTDRVGLCCGGEVLMTRLLSLPVPDLVTWTFELARVADQPAA